MFLIAISANDITRYLSMEECIKAIEDLYSREAGEISSQPMRTLSRIDKDSIILTMPSFSRLLNRFAVKIVSEYQNNSRNFALPNQGGVILLFDSRNSQPLAILDSPHVTAIRTGAVSGLATKLLARKDAKLVSVIGSGQQARTQLEAVCAVRKISEAQVFSRNISHAEKMAQENTERLHISCFAQRDREKALKDADVIILATNSTEPVIKWNEIPSGSHINSIGTLPERRELDLETVCNSSLYVDVKEGVLKEAGDIMHAIELGKIQPDHVLGDLSELISGRCVGRRNEKEVTLFKSVGFGLQDVYASSFVFEKLSNDEKYRELMTVPELHST